MNLCFSSESDQRSDLRLKLYFIHSFNFLLTCYQEQAQSYHTPHISSVLLKLPQSIRKSSKTVENTVCKLNVDFLAIFRMIDFAHVFDEPRRDDSYVFGLQNLIIYLKQILKNL